MKLDISYFDGRSDPLLTAVIEAWLLPALLPEAMPLTRRAKSCLAADHVETRSSALSAVVITRDCFWSPIFNPLILRQLNRSDFGYGQYVLRFDLGYQRS
jgi:hypothetical protein